MRAAPVLLVAAALLLAAGCAGVSPAQKKEASARMEMGVTYLQQRNLPAAMRELSKASELDPGNPEVDMMLGLAYQSRGDLGKAEEYLRIAIEKKPDYAEAHNNLGNLMSQLGRGEEAIREYEKAASNVLYPTPEYAYYNMGREYYLRNELDKAEEKYGKAIALNPSFLDAYRGLAIVQGKQEKWEDVVKTLEAEVKAAPTHALGWMDLGNAYLKLRRHRDAVAAFRNVLLHSTDADLRKQATNYLNLLKLDER
jgi:type IV pilus biogenesis/stability protein PilW